MTRSPVAMAMSVLLVVLVAACSPIRAQEGASSDAGHKRHNDWARFGRPDIGGARANDR